MTIPKINSAHGSDTRNIINRAIDLINVQGKSIQDLVAEGQLTPEQYATLIQIVNGLISKGNVSVHDIDINQGKLLPRHMSEELLSMITGDAPINAVPADESITLNKLAFNKKSTNLFDRSKIVKGYRVSTFTGNLVEDASFQLSPVINVDGSTTYYVGRTRHVVFYDEDDNIIDSISNGGYDHVFTTPPNTKSLRFSWEHNLLNDRQRMNRGGERLPYEDYYIYIDAEYIERHEVTSNDIVDRSVNYQKTDFIEIGKNLFNPNEATLGVYVSPTGSLWTNEDYLTSNRIRVKALEKLIANRLIRFLAFYKSDGDHLLTEENISAGTVITPPNEASTIRVSFLKTQINDFQLEKGDAVTPYEPYGYKIPKLLQANENIADESKVMTFLPEEVNVAVGRTIELYNRQVVWAGNMDNVHIQWESDIGRPFKRKWSFYAESEHIGQYPLRINVYDNNMNMIDTKATTVNVVAETLNGDYDVVTIGDSLTNNKPWLNELENLSGGRIKNIGTRQGRHEGRSGVRAGWYLNDSQYTFDANYDESNTDTDGTENPFYNPTTNTFDFEYYKTSYNKDPDAVQIFLGTNGISLDPTDNANDIKTIVDGIHENDTSMPIFVVNTLYRGDQDGIAKQAGNDGYSAARGQWKLEEDRKVFNLMEELHKILKDYENVHFVPVALTHDSEYNFGQVETPVNPRSEVTELQPSEATHPQTPGYLQMADIMFSTMVAKFD